jgi:hypothetical protein
MIRRKMTALLMVICLVTGMALLMTACGSRDNTAEQAEEAAAAEDTEPV